MYSSDYYTHNESSRSNLFPFVKVYIYENWKDIGYTKTTSSYSQNVTSLGKPDRPRYSISNNSKRLEITDFIINIGNINQQGNSDIIQNFTGSSSGSISIIRNIDFITDINFDLQPNDSNNIFSVLGYEYDGSLADFEITVGFKNDYDDDNTSILVVGGSPYEEVIFRGKVSNISPTETSLEINLVDGMFEAMNTQALIGEQINNEKIFYHDRFFLDSENNASSENLSSIYGGWNLNLVKKEVEFNLRNLPVIPPQRDSFSPTVDVKIQRKNPEEWIEKTLSSQQNSYLDYDQDFKYDFIKGNYVEKIGQGDYFDFKNFAVDYGRGLLQFEIPPIREPEGFIVANYKTAYRYQHPSFLAEKLFNQLGYEKDNSGEYLNFKKDEIDPNYPGGSPDTEDFNYKVKSFLGQITPLEDGNTEGIKTIHYCTTDKLFYYYANKGVWRTDLNNYNEKLFGTTYDILQIDSLYLGDYSSHDNAKRLRLIMSYRNKYRYMFAPPPVKPIHTAMEGVNKLDPDSTVRPMKDFVSNLSDKDLWKEDFTVSLGIRDIDGVTTSGVKMSIYFQFDGWIWRKDWDNTKKEYKEDERLIKIPKTFYCHHTIGGDTYIEKKPLNIKKILYKNNPYGSGWESEFNSFYDTNSDYDVIFANTDFKVDNDNRRYLMIWADVFEDPLETAIKLGQNESNVDFSEIKREYIFFIRIDDGGFTPTFENCLVDINLDDGTIVKDQFDVQLAIFMPAVDTISTSLSGSETQEPDYDHLTNWSTNNGNLAHGIRKIKFQKMGNDLDTFIEIKEPKFSRNTWANQVDLGMDANSQNNNNEQLENFGISYRSSDTADRWTHSSIYEYPYFLGNELTTNFVLHKGSDWYGVKRDVYLIAICARTPTPFQESFLDYALYDGGDDTNDMDGAGEGGTKGQYIYLTWFKVSDYNWNLNLNLTINHPHKKIKNSTENTGTTYAGNDLVYGVTNTSSTQTNSEPFYGLNWSRDATGWMIKGRSSTDTFSPLSTTNFNAPDESDYDRYSTVLDRFFVIGGYNRCKRSAETFLGVDLCIDYEEIDNPLLEGYTGTIDPDTHPAKVIRPSVYVFSGEHISKWVMNSEHGVWNTNQSFDVLDIEDGEDTNNDTQGYNILRRDTTWGEIYGGLASNQIPSWHPSGETSGRTGRLFLKKWDTDTNDLSHGYDGYRTLESPYWHETEKLTSTSAVNTVDITASYPSSVTSGSYTGGKYKCNVSSTGNYVTNQANNVAYSGDNNHTDSSSYKTIPWWDTVDLGGQVGLDTVITGKDFISAHTSSFEYYLPSSLWSKEDCRLLRVHQVYGLTKMKGKQVFTFVGVNRDYEVYPTNNTTKKDLVANTNVGGDKMYSHIKNEVSDQKNVSDNEFLEGLTSVIYCLDLENTYTSENAGAWWWKKERLRPLSSLMPTLLHDDYFETLDSITNEYEKLRFQKDEKGSYIPLSQVFQNASLGLSKGYSAMDGGKIAKESGRGEGTWISECAMAQTQISNHGVSSDFIYTPYKSKWERFSHLTVGGNDGTGGFAFHPFTTDNFELSYGNFTEGDIITKDGFEYALQDIRGRFANEHVLNSILPKTSFNVGMHCCYLIGNYGEYLTTKTWLELAEHYKDVDWLNDYGQNQQDSHGTLVYLPNNFSKAPTGKLNTSKHFESKSKGYIHNVNSDNVYKDFLTKPIYTNIKYREEKNSREEVHFISGMSIGYKRIMQDLQLNRSKKKTKKEKWTNPLMFYRKYDTNNFNWTVLSDYLKPRIPIADFSGQNIKDSLQNLALLMDYDFGIRNGEPFFEPSYKTISPQTFYYTYQKHDGSANADPQNYTTTDAQWLSRFLNVGNESGVIKDAFLCPEEMSFTNGKYYFLKGEIIFITKNNWNSNVLPDVYEDGNTNHPNDNTELYSNDRWAWAYRHVEKSVSKVKYLENKRCQILTISYPIPNTTPSRTIKRIQYAEDMLLFEIKSIFNDKNIIDIQEYGRTYDFQEFTDLHIHYGENKTYKLKIQGGKNYKRVLRKDIPYIDNKDWIKYLSKSIVRNINTKKYKIDFTSKLIPSLKYGDYIAINNSYLKIGDDNSSVIIPQEEFGQTETITDYQGYNNYELYKVSSANHDITNFTTSITAYTIDTSSIHIEVDTGAIQDSILQDFGGSV